ncbi:MAG: flagellar biosynthesis protein FlgD [Rhizobium sp. 63-7]|nr:MAG: flagellar biosynthesis protein FlgD [Rhizobium sp. 63-7]
MAVSGVNSVAAPTGANGKADSAASAASLNYQSFLKLLIAQMKNQDPTDPMDATQQVSQLATFSQVEQAIQTNKNLEYLIQSQSLTQASNYIGKTLTSADDSVTGVIKEVEVYSDGLIAITEDGKKILIQAGIKISNGPSSSTPTDGGTDQPTTAAEAMGTGTDTTTGETTS